MALRNLRCCHFPAGASAASDDDDDGNNSSSFLVCKRVGLVLVRWFLSLEKSARRLVVGPNLHTQQVC